MKSQRHLVLASELHVHKPDIFPRRVSPRDKIRRALRDAESREERAAIYYLASLQPCRCGEPGSVLWCDACAGRGLIA